MHSLSIFDKDIILKQRNNRDVWYLSRLVFYTIFALMDVAEALQKMEAYIAKFPADLLDGLAIGREAIKQFNISAVNHVIIAGLGGSGIGGRIVENVVRNQCKAPILFAQDYHLPAWANNSTLFIAVSYSGNTEETLATLAEAEAKKCQIVCITSGGKLAEIAQNRGHNFMLIPSGQPPRTSLGWNSVQQFFALYAYGLIDNSFVDELTSTAELLQKEKGSIVTQAEEIALSLENTLPIIYADAAVESVAVRFRQQVNENGKMLCWHHVLPEMNHNELVGWAGAQGSHSVVIIRSAFDHPRTISRMELTKHLVRDRAKIIIELHAKGQSRLEAMYYLVHLGDWISYALAELAGIDPIDISIIEQFKNSLNQS